jgi:hypothetical protein
MTHDLLFLYFRRKNQSEDSELKYSGRVHSIRIPPHRIILSGCLLSFSDYTAAHFRYLGEGHQVIILFRIPSYT